MGVTGVNHITLVVADLDRARRFYEHVLGARARAEGPNAVYLELGSLWLCLERGTPRLASDDGHIALASYLGLEDWDCSFTWCRPRRASFLRGAAFLRTLRKRSYSVCWR